MKVKGNIKRHAKETLDPAKGTIAIGSWDVVGRYCRCSFRACKGAFRRK